MMNADEIIKTLGMEEHVEEGGYFTVTWRNDRSIPQEILPGTFDGARQIASCIYYLLKADQISKWHKLLADEYWYWHCGGTLEMTLGGEGHTPVEGQKLRIGCDISNGESFQVHAPAGHWQTTKVINGDFVLVSCVVVPGFEEEDCYFV